jgi:hypothetical protein
MLVDCGGEKAIATVRLTALSLKEQNVANRETLLVLLRPEFNEIFIYNVKHRGNIDPREAFHAAFRDFAETKEGAEYVESNGANWGDALQIPFKYFEKQGILMISQRNDDGILVAQHDESLLDCSDLS